MPDRSFNPMMSFDRVLDEVDRRLNETVARVRGARPAIDLYDDGDALILRAVIPGATVNDVHVALEQRNIMLRGEMAPSIGRMPTDTVTWYRREIASGPFEERIPLPIAVDAEETTATFADGILTLIMPKTGPERVKRIVVRPTAPERPPEPFNP